MTFMPDHSTVTPSKGDAALAATLQSRDRSGRTATKGEPTITQASQDSGASGRPRTPWPWPNV